MINVGSDFSGVGAFEQALMRLGVQYNTVFACDIDKFARQTFIHNYGTDKDKELLRHPDVAFCDDVYYRLFVNRKLDRPTISEVKKLLAIQEKTARLFSFYYPWNVKYRIPNEPLDIYMTSPPCQAFSLAGERKGEEDDRGILFYNSHEFIQKNRPRYFIFENVKGLLSDNNGRTFQRWIDYLGGKSVNGTQVMFPHQNSTPYHVYYQVLNAKDYGTPQNRERIFIIGIRDDEDNNFRFPKPIPLEKRLKDILEEDVDEKYFLSDKMIDGFIKSSAKHEEKGTGFKWPPKSPEDIGNCLRSNGALNKTDNTIKIGFINQDTQASQVFDKKGLSQTLCAGTHGYANGYISIGAIQGRNPDNPKSRKSGLETVQMLEINEQGLSNCLTTVQKDNVVVNNYRIRRLTPREAFRLMDFPDTFSWTVSDSQAYKQAGNSIVVSVLALIIENLLK